MKILVINSGSSSVKYQLFEMNDRTVLSKGLVERIGISGSRLTHYAGEKVSFKVEQEIADHRVALRLIFDALTHAVHGVLQRVQDIDAIGHRVVHGGEIFNEAKMADKETKEGIKRLCELAPLHNPANLLGIEACERIIPGIRQVAVFDTSFHHTIPKHSYMYALPYEYYEKYGIRRYGFHGTSHNYVAQRAARMIGKPLEQLKIITCHLGSGSSISAISGGRSIDTSMGFTPLEGVAMGTRCGDIDPAAITYLIERESLSPKDINDILNNKSGVLGVSGISSDFRDLEKAAEEGNERAKLAVEIFVHRVKKYIGAYVAVLNGLDALVFTAGLGENSPEIRARICKGLEFLGLSVEEEKNDVRGREADISAANSRVRVLVIPTNEELMIASETERVITAQ